MISGTLSFESLDQVTLLCLLAVEGTLLLALFLLETGSLITSSQQIHVSCVISLRSLLEVVVLVFANFGEFTNTFLELVEIVLGGLDSLVSLSILALLVTIHLTETIDLLLITATLLLQLLKLKVGSVNIFSQSIGVVTLALAVTLVAENFCLTTGDLLTKGSNLCLHVIISTALVIEVVASIVTLFLQTVESDAVRVLASLKLVFLQEFFVLKVTVLRLNSVKLVSQSEVVLIPLLNLEDFSLQLRNEEILLITGQMHTIVILQQIRKVVRYTYS